MPLLTLRADYNIAGLYYLRGEYTRALDMYRAAREQSDRLGDPYIGALCDLDRSEIYLELNLGDEAADLAAQALERFETLGDELRSRQGGDDPGAHDEPLRDGRRSHALFEHARAACSRARATRSGSASWISTRRSCCFATSATRARDQAVPAGARGSSSGPRCRARRRSAICCCRAWRCRPATAARRNRRASAAFEQAGRRRDADARPTRRTACSACCARRRANPTRAYEAFQQADRQSRTSPQPSAVGVAQGRLPRRQAGRLRAPRHDVPHLRTGRRRTQETAFRYIEKAKSRSLADLIAFRAVNLTPRVAGAASDEVRRLRQELIWHSRQVEQEELKPEGPSAAPHGERSRPRRAAIEKQLVKALDEIRRTDEEFSALAKRHDVHASTRFARAWRPTRSSSSTTRPWAGSMCVCSATIAWRSCRSAPAGEVRSRLQLLQFQLAKFRRGPDD